MTAHEGFHELGKGSRAVKQVWMPLSWQPVDFHSAIRHFAGREGIVAQT